MFECFQHGNIRRGRGQGLARQLEMLSAPVPGGFAADDGRRQRESAGMCDDALHLTSYVSFLTLTHKNAESRCEDSPSIDGHAVFLLQVIGLGCGTQLEQPRPTVR